MQGEQLLDFDRNFRKLVDRSRQSYNVNSFDEVPNSSWFTNRMGSVPMTAEQVAQGATESQGPDTSGEWIVFRPKVQGVSPGFWIEDKRGDRYIIKFDPPDFPEMSTSAEAMAARYFHACGYNVPEVFIVKWRPENLRVKPDVTFKDRTGVTRTFTQEDLTEILGRVHHEPDGTIRSLASKLIAGKVVGPFSYDGTVDDDPNDWCPHEHRRELRALYVIASLVNHYDAKDQNTLDVYVEEDSRHFVKHFLIDFSSTFGANSDDPKAPIHGYANTFDIRDVFVSLVTLGTKTWPWEHAKPSPYPGLGYFESEIFEPNKFDPIVPNPAWENMTARDAYWGAKVVMAFRDEHLRAIVSTGKISDSAGAAYLVKTLGERRDKIGRFWFAKVNPLDNFEARSTGAGLEIQFKDLAREYGFSADQAMHRMSVSHKGKRIGTEREFTQDRLDLAQIDLVEMANVYSASRNGDDMEEHLFEVRIKSKRDDNRWSKPVALWLWYAPEHSEFELVGVEHLD